MRAHLPLSIVALLFVATAHAESPAPGLPTVAPKKAGMSAQRLDRIGPLMQRYIDDELVPGTVTLVARRGKVVHFEARGEMDAENDVAMRSDAIFRIASMTKPITSVALMMLWEQGLFQLRDPIAKYLPEFAGQKVSTTMDASGKTGEMVPVKAPATIRQLLTHTAGQANSYIGNGKAYRELMKAPEEGEDLEAWTKRFAAVPLNYQPGTKWQYSAATSVVGRLVEVLSGQPLDEYFREHIFKPLGMSDTHFYLDDTVDGRLAAQYTPGKGGKIRLDDPGSAASRWITGPKKMFHGSGGLVSTAHDYIRFQQMVLDGGELEGVRLLSPATVSLMLENHTGDLPLWLAGPGMGFGMGYGVVVDRGTAATPLSPGAAYWGGAYCTYSWIDPEQEIVAVLMTQVRPYVHLNIRQDFQNLVYSAIVE